jgi:carboxyl-terminal processing protease
LLARTECLPRYEQIAVSEKIIDVQLKAYIARNMLDNKGFYPVWQEIDRTLLDALSYLENN